MRKLRLLGCLAVCASAALTPVRASSYREFRDLPQSAWYEEYIDEALNMGILDGVDGNTFAPDDSIRSIDAAKAFYRMAGQPYWIDAEYFSDVSAGPDSLAASYCIDTAIMSGYMDGTFRPDESISCSDLIVMDYIWAIRNGKAEDPAFTQDLSSYDWSGAALKWAEESGLVSDHIREILNSPITRAEACEIFVKTAALPAFEQAEPEAESDPETEEAAEISEETETSEQTPAAEPSLSNAPEQDALQETEPAADETSGSDCQPETETASPSEAEPAAEAGQDQNAKDEPDHEEMSWFERLFNWTVSENPDAVNPGKAAGVDVSNAEMYGIDISEHQGDIDLTPYKDQFVIIRAGWHTTEDLYYRQNIAKCEQLGIPYGIYWYSYALDETQAREEAEAFKNALQGTSPSMGVWIDMENDSWKSDHGFTVSGENISSIASTIGETIREAGYQPGIYCSSRWMGYFDERMSDYPFWIAYYGRNDGDIHADYSDRAVMYQYTSNPIDKNILYRSDVLSKPAAGQPSDQKTEDCFGNMLEK